jgi:hypothetical protein
MAKVKAYYDKGQLVPICTTPSFYAYPIEVDADVLKHCEQLNDLFAGLEREHQTAAFPRDAQDLADQLGRTLKNIMKAQRSKKNVKADAE